MFLGASALRERSPHTISAAPVHGCVALPRLPSISKPEPEKVEEIEVKTVSENRVRAPEIDPNTAIDQCIVEMIEAEPGCEFRFAEILRHYTIQANSRWKSGWPREVSTVALSRRLKDAGAVRFQKRYSDRDKPIYYRLPETVPEHLKAWRKLQ